ncbi:hypothetical protein CONPUDRAFT_46865 [Coniophora puteana RWD-64-598 SS2]|uniref:CxC2-like cysteine cluster KDZ transposase-associated domain-containing protein n=1 Tax=Coniophora puteana (strain RWD-64-598) TaxID=741705 RepID=A0A5M3N5M9_CONPW|nr:uncharacterized protein CONPUDRAFT_46865 [Coniophora puteana RWD-64-598 SS2]EIW86722.1 hypothetical protein CONPUDRAFT_46865 [Coniophora puteana RWD-64-598 SS2]
MLQDKPLLVWVGDSVRPGYRDEYLKEDIRLEGRGHAAVYPCYCKSGRPREYRCENCSGCQMTCRECCVAAHQQMPLHHVQKWNGSFFERVSLKSLHLRVQMSHEDGSKCILRQSGHANFVVIHTNGVHRVSIDFCGCNKKVPHRQQLLRYGWFPSTVDTPETACTEEALAQYSALMSRTKVSAHGYYQALETLTDPLGLDVPPSHYKAFLRIIRQREYVRLMKEAGRGNVPNGIETTGAGQLAVACPACPHPEINLPDGWEKADASQKFLYCLFLAMDANFRLKNRDRGPSTSDTELFDGLAYFVETGPYMEHIKRHTAEKETSTCSSFRAISGVNNKTAKGLQATGVGMVMCARHEFIMALGVGDLQVGERNCNMDYMFFSVFATLLLLLVVISYDIACQWKINLFKRMDRLPAAMQALLVSVAEKLIFGVPKFHAPGHNEACATEHSLNLMEGAGRTDGEGIERGWAEFNLASNSTKEMTLGFRHDTLNILFTCHNLRKYYNLGDILRRRLLLAVEAHAAHQEALLVFDESIGESTRNAWTAMRVAWENDKSNPNPYISSKKSITEADLRAQLAEAERNIPFLPHDISPSTFVKLAFEIEDKQRRVRADVARLKDLTAEERAQLEHRRSSIRREIVKFRDIQRVYMPGIDALIAARERNVNTEVENETLWLPSGLGEIERKLCIHRVDEVEMKLRVAQCHSLLDRIRGMVQTRYHFTLFRNLNLRGQRAITRAYKLVQDYDRKVIAEQAKYDHAYRALLALGSQDILARGLRPLARRDIRALREPLIEADTPRRRAKEMERGIGEGHRTVSWIWTTGGPIGADWQDEEETQEGLRIQWLKACARKKRWEEEVALLKEEMRRVRAFLDHRASWWEKHAINIRTGSSEAVLDRQAIVEGVRAHALRQAHQQRRLRDSFTRKWERKWSAREAESLQRRSNHPDIDSDAEGGGDEPAEEADVGNAGERGGSRI